MYRVCITAMLVLLRWADRAYRIAMKHGDWMEDDRLSGKDARRIFDYLAGVGEPVQLVGRPKVSLAPPTGTFGTGATITYTIIPGPGAR